MAQQSWPQSSAAAGAAGSHVVPAITTAVDERLQPPVNDGDEALQPLVEDEDEAGWTVHEVQPVLFGRQVSLLGVAFRSRTRETLPPPSTFSSAVASFYAWAVGLFAAIFTWAFTAIFPLAFKLIAAIFAFLRGPLLKRSMAVFLWLGLFFGVIYLIGLSVLALEWHQPYLRTYTNGRGFHYLTAEATYYFKDLRLSNWYSDDQWNYYLFRSSQVPETELELVNRVVNKSTPPITVYYNGNENRYVIEASAVAETLESGQPWGCVVVARSDSGSVYQLGRITKYERSLVYDAAQRGKEWEVGKIALSVRVESETESETCPLKLKVQSAQYDLSKAGWRCEVPHTACEPITLEINRPATVMAVNKGIQAPDDFRHLECSYRLWVALLLYGCGPFILLLSVIGFLARLFCDMSVCGVVRRLLVALRIIRRRNSGIALPVAEEQALPANPVQPTSHVIAVLIFIILIIVYFTI